MFRLDREFARFEPAPGATVAGSAPHRSAWRTMSFDPHPDRGL
jgi:hypothetical protein